MRKRQIDKVYSTKSNIKQARQLTPPPNITINYFVMFSVSVCDRIDVYGRYTAR